VHRATAGEIFGVTPLEVTSEQRRYAKVINFGLIYGMSAHGLAKNLGIERAPRPTTSTATSRATRRRRLHGAHPPRGQDQRLCGTVFGRRLYLPDIRAQQVAAARAPSAPRSTRRCRAPPPT
jgi:DNA polymerase-1